MNYISYFIRNLLMSSHGIQVLIGLILVFLIIRICYPEYKRYLRAERRFIREIKRYEGNKKSETTANR